LWTMMPQEPAENSRRMTSTAHDSGEASLSNEMMSVSALAAVSPDRPWNARVSVPSVLNKTSACIR
jgi:hypothetical protein